MHFARRFALVSGLVITLIALGIIVKETTQKRRLPMEAEPTTSNFALTSSAFANNQPIPPLHTCKGQNVRPALAINNIPSGTQSLAIIMSDPDAVNGEWVHWLAWDIDPSITSIDEQSRLDSSIQGMTSFGKTGYDGPCPAVGTGVHRYVFDLYALDTKLNLPATSNQTQLKTAMQGHIKSQTRLTGSFSGD